MRRRTLTHEPDHHNGECIYCRGFSYGDAWWREQCEERAASERRRILAKPAAIREKIMRLRGDLKRAELEAGKAARDKKGTR